MHVDFINLKWEAVYMVLDIARGLVACKHTSTTSRYLCDGSSLNALYLVEVKARTCAQEDRNWHSEAKAEK